MAQCQLKNWPIFNFLDRKFIARIKTVMVCGIHEHSASTAFMVLEDDSVYLLDLFHKNCLASSGRSKGIFTPTKIDDLCKKGAKDFACSQNTPVLALTTKGEVFSCCWSQFSKQDFCFIPLNKKFFDGKEIIQIRCGHGRCLALTKEGQVFGLRNNGAWQLEKVCYGYSSSPRPTIQARGTLEDVKIIYVECNHIDNMAVSNDGEVYEWGNCTSSTVEDGHMYQGYKTVDNVLGIAIVKVACARFRIFALSDKGDLYAWEQFSHGRARNVKIEDYLKKISMKTTMKEKVVDIAAVYNTLAAITRTGQVFVWGHFYAQLDSCPIPTPLSDFHEVFAIYATSKTMHAPLTLRHDDDEPHIVIDSLRQAFDDPSTSDFTIEVEGRPIHVHKSVLIIRSTYFRSMFEKHWNKYNQPIQIYSQFSYNVYKSFLKYLYTGEIDVQEDNLIDLFDIASVYSELHLKARCMKKLMEGITVSNVWQLYDIAVTREYRELEDVCFQFAAKHIALAVKSPHYSKLSGERIKAFMTKAVVTGAFNI